MNEYLDYVAARDRNRHTFLLNYPRDFHIFESLFTALQATWSRAGKERDNVGNSYAGLLVLVEVLARQILLAFENLSAYQSFLAWVAFRPGLEALLMLGKFVDDPSNAGIWKNRTSDRKRYTDTFFGKALISHSLSRSDRFQQVLSHLNDDFLHSNVDYAMRHAQLKDEGKEIYLSMEMFDVDPEVHEANLLAFINLSDLIRQSSSDLICQLFGAARGASPIAQYAKAESTRAQQLAARNSIAKNVMETLGLWQF